MSYASRVYRHRNAHTHDRDIKSEPFFHHAEKQANASAGKPSFFQAKMQVNARGDRFEKEADSVADSVVNNKAGSPVVQQKNISSIQRLSTPQEDEKLGTNDARMMKDKEVQEKPEVQRKCSECEKEEAGAQPVQMMEKTEKKKPEGDLPMQAKTEAGQTAAPAVSAGIQHTKGRGRALPRQTMEEMSMSFGVNFSRVNIHTDDQAVAMNRSLHSQAFTHGKDIYFNAGKFNMNTPAGKHLLAHELTHVVQQGAVQRESLQAKPEKNNGSRKLVAKGHIPTNTVHCLKRWTPCSAPYSPGSWAARVSYHCPRLVWPLGIILPGTTQQSYVTIPDEFIGTGPRGGHRYRCRRKPKTMTLLTVADAAATGINRSMLYPGQQPCHDGFRAILLKLLQTLFSPSGGGPSGVRVNASLPVGGFPC